MTPADLQAIQDSKARAELARTDKIIDEILRPHLGEFVYYYTGKPDRGPGEEVWSKARVALVTDDTRAKDYNEYCVQVFNGAEMDPQRSPSEQRPRVTWYPLSPDFGKPCNIEYIVPKGVGPRKAGGK